MKGNVLGASLGYAREMNTSLLDTDLQLAPEPEGRILPAIVISLLVLIVVGAAVFYLNPRGTAKISVDKVSIFAPHTVFKGTPGTIHVLGTSAGAEDDLYVVIDMTITDELRLPLFINNATMTITQADGSEIEATSVSSTYYPRLQKTFPKLSPMLTAPFVQGDEIAPDVTKKGTFLVLFPGSTETIWKNRKSAKLALNLLHQAPQVIQLPTDHP
jgi:hypothetical protein